MEYPRDFSFLVRPCAVTTTWSRARASSSMMMFIGLEVIFTDTVFMPRQEAVNVVAP